MEESVGMNDLLKRLGMDPISPLLARSREAYEALRHS